MISPDEVLVWFSRKYGRMSQWGSSRVPSYPFAQSSAFIVFSARPISYTPPFLCQRLRCHWLGERAMLASLSPSIRWRRDTQTQF